MSEGTDLQRAEALSHLLAELLRRRALLRLLLLLPPPPLLARGGARSHE